VDTGVADGDEAENGTAEEEEEGTTTRVTFVEYESQFCFSATA